MKKEFILTLCQKLDDTLPEYLTRRSISKALDHCFTVGTLANYSQEIPYVLCGGKAIYQKGQFLDWLKAHLIKENGI